MSRYGAWSDGSWLEEAGRRQPSHRHGRRTSLQRMVMQRAAPKRGRVVSVGRGYLSRNVITDERVGAYAKGFDVLLDALLLSKCVL